MTRFPVPRGLVGTLARRPKRAVRAVDGVTFSLSDGEMLALVGESGSGKTTTAQTILRLVDADSGTIRFQGEDISHASGGRMRALRRHAQLIFQDLHRRPPLGSATRRGAAARARVPWEPTSGKHGSATL